MSRGGSMAKTCCQHRQRNGKGAGSRGGGEAKQNQIKRQINVTNTTTKAAKEAEGTSRDCQRGGSRGRGAGGEWVVARTLGWQPSRSSRKRRPQNGCLKTQLHNNLFTFFHTPSTLNEQGESSEGEG